MIDIKENKNFCPAPWISVYVEPNGRVDNCCVARNNLGQLNDNTSVDDIVLGPVNTQLQQAMLDNQVVKGCSWCHGSGQNLQSQLINWFPNMSDAIYQTGKFDLRYLDVRWSNTCNLACVFCSETFSSLWAQELGKTIRLERAEKNKFLDYVIGNVKSLKHVYLAGGEPLLMKENELLLDELIKQDNTNCKILVNTNLTNINNRIYQQLITFPNVDWLVSVEGTGQTYEYLRYPAKWEEFKSNLLQLQQDVDQHRILFNMVFLSLNALSFWDTVDYLKSLGFHSQSFALYNNGVFPGPFDPTGLSLEFRQQVIERMSKGNYQRHNGYSNILDYIASDNRTSVQFVDTLKNIDARRNLNSRSIFPEIYKAIES